MVFKLQDKELRQWGSEGVSADSSGRMCKARRVCAMKEVELRVREKGELLQS